MSDKDFAAMGWTELCYSEAVSDVVKTVKDHETTKTGLQWAAEHL